MTNPTDMRDSLLRLVMNAPDPCGYEKVLPGYQSAWDSARQILRQTCPNHIDDGGTCPHCHGDTD